MAASEGVSESEVRLHLGLVGSERLATAPSAPASRPRPRRARGSRALDVHVDQRPVGVGRRPSCRSALVIRAAVAAAGGRARTPAWTRRRLVLLPGLRRADGARPSRRAAGRAGRPRRPSPGGAAGRAPAPPRRLRPEQIDAGAGGAGAEPPEAGRAAAGMGVVQDPRCFARWPPRPVSATSRRWIRPRCRRARRACRSTRSRRWA